MFDKDCIDSTDNNLNMTVPWYLMAAYAYYVEDNPILSDSIYDRIVRRMVENWNQIEHFHKNHIELDALKAGTFLGDYPPRVKDAVKALRGTKNGR